MPINDPTTQSGIYQIRHIASGRVYIGSTVNISMRWSVHRNQLAKGIHDSSHLQNAWKKYGSDQFVFEILEIVENKTDLVRIEQEYIDRYREFDHAIVYNIRHVARSNLGFKASPETRAKISAAKKGCGKGKKLSPEHRAKISASGKGLKRTPETRAKIAAAKKGRQRSSEHCANISAAKKGQGRGRKHSPETKAKMSAAAKVRKHTLETRAKMSASQKARYLRLSSLSNNDSAARS